jgi:16S rRNA (guanine(966)-N(2))-methyltransferase RsmD
MRIISGKWGGRKLAAFKSNDIRPTTDRIKETLFNIIGPGVIDSSFLDLFSGTGSITLEALSRGAKDVTSVDQGKDAKNIFLKNATLLEATNDVHFVSSDVFKFLNRNIKTFDYIFVDPPFTKKMGAEVMKCLSDSKALNESTMIFIEYVKGEEIFNLESSDLYEYKIKDYKDKLLYIYKLKDKERST